MKQARRPGARTAPTDEGDEALCNQARRQRHGGQAPRDDRRNEEHAEQEQQDEAEDATGRPCPRPRHQHDAGDGGAEGLHHGGNGFGDVFGGCVHGFAV